MVVRNRIGYKPQSYSVFLFLTALHRQGRWRQEAVSGRRVPRVSCSDGLAKQRVTLRQTRLLVLLLIMVHVRLNEKEANPNQHVNFITALPCPNAQNQEDARQYLRALAAQVRPIMKDHGLTVNSLEEGRLYLLVNSQDLLKTFELVRAQHGLRWAKLERR